MAHDVEKRWNNRATSRAALIHVGATIACASLAVALALIWMANRQTPCHLDAFSACTDAERYVLVLAPAAILLVGGLWALFRAYRAWKNQFSWPIWQGTGWSLLILMTIYLVASTRLLVTG
ncbi:hypothetical protein [Rhodococcus sp. 24CO]|uniref:hypothetical protein n=1 Tax=Rhodococcus sp. 24CO TaxID=3117460 RepID=UPI003D32DF8A